ncbi:MAG: hypothetical protein HC817_14985 [Saprospiraceae bacterium]|nr:hypothetical protein [Saprospiraceae bacterium]
MQKKGKADLTTQNTEGVPANDFNLVATGFFNKKFPKATDVFWDSLDNGFMATFFDETHDKKAFFDVRGQFEYATTVVELEELPKTIADFLKRKYPKAEIAIAQIVEDDHERAFHIEIENFMDYISLEFDKSGQLRKETKHPLSNEELQREEEEGVDNQ